MKRWGRNPDFYTPPVSMFFGIHWSQCEQSSFCCAGKLAGTATNYASVNFKCIYNTCN